MQQMAAIFEAAIPFGRLNWRQLKMIYPLGAFHAPRIPLYKAAQVTERPSVEVFRNSMAAAFGTIVGLAPIQ